MCVIYKYKLYYSAIFYNKKTYKIPEALAKDI